MTATDTPLYAETMRALAGHYAREAVRAGLAFNPPPECDRPGCCNLDCVWPADEPLFGSIDGDTADKLALVADPEAAVGRDMVAAFLAACEADARANGGLVSVNRVSAALPDDITSTERYAAMWGHFTGKGKPMRRATTEDHPHPWEERKGSRSGNDGKPMRLRFWEGSVC